MIKVGIVGSSGYVAGELIRCLVHHPKVELDFLYSHSNAGKSVSDIHKDLIEFSELKFTDIINPIVDIIFLCTGHGNSSKFLSENKLSDNTKIIDLSNDFRVNNDKFVYGLIEHNRELIKKSNYIANPGCFATAIQLGLMPLASKKILNDDIHINAITGSTGAGQSLSETSHFTWRNNNISVYKAFQHQHIPEIKQTIHSLQNDFNSELNLIPVRGNFTRGIFTTIYTKSILSEAELIDLYNDYYKEEPFVFISMNQIDLKQVVNTNNCVIQVQKIGDKVLVTSIIDNLLKGAAGTAIQNMNLMFGIEETTGLKYKGSYH
ncbi:MAG: N-acetyl-gamma-glutamyl-phosphate reductase [Ignavibacteriae bacterium HGW-Ignavibacteriae-4]|jgi:N-acetyl-gamma-glutamyl-phosphate reductase|nr:MAG: N-acetyl-gamma-glutamyl-phosphate reductase [Ignavibacteriae bacterium HGW-Ignavibacteriae-4]